MREREPEKFDDDHEVTNAAPHESGDSLSHQGEYVEVNYSLDDGTPIDQEALGQFSPDAKTEYAFTEGGFPLEERLRGTKTPEEYARLVADLEAFYVAQVEALEGDEPTTIADAEVVQIAQAIEESAAVGGSIDQPQPPREIMTSDNALEYLKHPGILEKVNDKARKAIAIMLSATAFAAAMPTGAQGIGQPNREAQRVEQMHQQAAEQARQRATQREQQRTQHEAQMRQQARQHRAQDVHRAIQYGIERGVQEAQIARGTRFQFEQIRANCNQAIFSVESDAQLQIRDIQIQHGINLNGVALLGPNAEQEFRHLNPNPTRQELAAFAHAQRVALHADRSISRTVASCDSQMRREYQTAVYNRTNRILADIPVIIRVR